MRAGDRARGALVLTFFASAAACGGTAFSAASDDGGQEATVGGPDAAPRPDAGHKPDSGGTGHRDGGSHDASEDRGSIPDVTVLKDVSVGSDGSGPDATSAMDAPSATDAMDAAHGKDANADGGCGVNKTTTFGSDHYVTADGTALPGSPCTLTNPCGTIANALSVAKPGDKIYVGPGAYTSSAPFALPDGVSVLGGWTGTTTGTNWVEECNPSASEVTISVNAQNVISIDSSAATAAYQTTTLKNLTLQNTATATAGQSLYGIIAVGNGTSSLVLDNVGVAVPSGGTGATGATGIQGAPGAAGGCAEVAAGAVGTTGPAAGAGTYGATGYTAAAPGVGTVAGTGGTGATPAPTVTCPPGQNGLTPGNGNPTACANPTGSEVACQLLDLVVTCAPPTNAGCGGSGGTGGFPGGGGGSSIALFLWNENAAIESGSLIAGSGGIGGTGGAGGPGGPGAMAGAAGGGTATYSPGCHSVATGTKTDPMTTCELEQLATVTALPGGPGLSGVAGGQGGGGAGGDSYAYYVGPTPTSATVTISGSPTFTPGTPAGPGAPGGAPNGNPGNSGLTNH